MPQRALSTRPTVDSGLVRAYDRTEIRKRSCACLSPTHTPVVDRIIPVSRNGRLNPRRHRSRRRCRRRCRPARVLCSPTPLGSWTVRSGPTVRRSGSPPRISRPCERQRPCSPLGPVRPMVAGPARGICWPESLRSWGSGRPSLPPDRRYARRCRPGCPGPCPDRMADDMVRQSAAFLELARSAAHSGTGGERGPDRNRVPGRTGSNGAGPPRRSVRPGRRRSGAATDRHDGVAGGSRPLLTRRAVLDQSRGPDHPTGLPRSA